MPSNHCVGSFLALTTSIGVFGILGSNVDAWTLMYLHTVSCLGEAVAGMTPWLEEAPS